MRVPREYLPFVHCPPFGPSRQGMPGFETKTAADVVVDHVYNLSGTDWAKVGSWTPTLRVARYDGTMTTIRDGAIEGVSRRFEGVLRGA